MATRRLRVAVLAAAALLGGCERAAYTLQAAGGHLELMARAQPVERVIADPATPAALRERLAVAAAIRTYASQALALPDNGSYRSYAELGRPYAVWNVVAAPEFSLAPVQSCFPVAGCVSYRGWTAHAAAERHAARLRAEGHDVVVQGVPAYSTLGWFDDPLLSTFIRYPDVELARLVFHELAHQVAYAKDDSTFNESFAVAVEREGLRRWLRASGREAELGRLEDAERRAGEFAALMGGARARLESLYRSRLAPDEMRRRKREALETLVRDYETLRAGRWGGFSGYDRFLLETPPNNALLALFATYTRHVGAFERLLAEEGGDLERFYGRVKSLAGLSRAERDSRMAPR